MQLSKEDTAYLTLLTTKRDNIRRKMRQLKVGRWNTYMRLVNELDTVQRRIDELLLNVGSENGGKSLQDE
jgi:hypothetical protein